MKDLHKAARQLWQQFADAGVNLNSINFQTLVGITGSKLVIEIDAKLTETKDARLVESDDESQKA